MSSYIDRIAELIKRQQDIEGQLTALASARKSYALAASAGDTKAAKQIAEVDFAADSLTKQAMTLASALESAEALARQEALAAEAKAQRDRGEAAYKLARAVVTLNLEIDEIFVHLREACERRLGLLAALGNTGLVDSMFISKLSNRAAPTRAACAAGLHKFLALETVAPQSMIPLASTNQLLLGIGAPPPDKATPQPRATSRSLVS